MKKAFFAIMVAMITMVVSVGFAFSAEVEKAEAKLISVSGEVYARSAYVGDSGMVVYKGLVIQPSITVSHNFTGLYVSAWGSVAPGKSPTSDNGVGENCGSEVDFYLGIAKKIGKFEADLHYAYYKLFPLNEWGKGDIHAINAKIGYVLTERIFLYAKVEYDHVVDRTEQNGFSYRAGSSFSLHEHLKADISVGGHGTIFGTREELISSGKIAVSSPWTYGPITVIPEVAFQKRFGFEVENGGISKDILYGSIGVTF